MSQPGAVTQARSITLVMTLDQDQVIVIANLDNRQAAQGSTDFGAAMARLRPLLDTLNAGDPSNETFRAVGELVGELLLPGSVLTEVVLPALRQGVPVRLCLQFAGSVVDGRLTVLPWELAYVEASDGDSDSLVPLLLEYDCSLVRDPGRGANARPPVVPQGDLRVFRASCLRASDSEQRARRELADRAMVEAVGAVPAPRVQLEFGEVRSPESGPRLARSLSADGAFDIFHFVGHGEQTGAGTVELLLDRGRLSAADLVDSLDGTGVSVAVVAACHSGASTGVSYGGVVADLLGNGLLAVVAMQRRVDERHAQLFLTGFYEGLARTGSLEDAMREGRTKVKDARWSHMAEWYVPVLYSRHTGELRVGPSTAPVFEEPPHRPRPTPSPAAVRPWVRVRATAVVLLTRGSELDAVQVFDSQLQRRTLRPEQAHRWSLAIDGRPSSLVLADDGSHLVSVANGVLGVHHVRPDGSLRPWRRTFPVPQGSQAVSCWHAGSGSVRVYLLAGERLSVYRVEEERPPRQLEVISEDATAACARDDGYVVVDTMGDLGLSLPAELADVRWCDVDRARGRGTALTAAVGESADVGSLLLCIREAEGSATRRWVRLGTAATTVAVARAQRGEPFAAAAGDADGRYVVYRWEDLPAAAGDPA